MGTHSEGPEVITYLQILFSTCLISVWFFACFYWLGSPMGYAPGIVGTSLALWWKERR